MSKQSTMKIIKVKKVSARELARLAKCEEIRVQAEQKKLREESPVFQMVVLLPDEIERLVYSFLPDVDTMRKLFIFQRYSIHTIVNKWECWVSRWTSNRIRVTALMTALPSNRVFSRVITDAFEPKCIPDPAKLGYGMDNPSYQKKYPYSFNTDVFTSETEFVFWRHLILLEKYYNECRVRNIISKSPLPF